MPSKRLDLIRQAEAIMETGSAAAAGRLGDDQRRLVQLRQGPQSTRLFRHLRRRPARYGVAGQSLNERGSSMNDPRFARPSWTRRGVLQGSAAAHRRSLRSSLARRSCRRDTRPVRRLEISVEGPRAQPEERRRAALRHIDAPAAFRHPPGGNDRDARRDGPDVRQSHSPQPARQWQDDHPRLGAQLGDLQGR